MVGFWKKVVDQALDTIGKRPGGIPFTEVKEWALEHLSNLGLQIPDGVQLDTLIKEAIEDRGVVSLATERLCLILGCGQLLRVDSTQMDCLAPTCSSICLALQ